MMKSKLLAMIVSALLVCVGTTGLATENGYGGSDGHEIDHSEHVGKSIHESEVDGY